MDFLLILDAILQIINIIEAIFRLIGLFSSGSGA